MMMMRKRERKPGAPVMTPEEEAAAAQEGGGRGSAVGEKQSAWRAAATGYKLAVIAFATIAVALTLRLTMTNSATLQMEDAQARADEDAILELERHEDLEKEVDPMIRQVVDPKRQVEPGTQWTWDQNDIKSMLEIPNRASLHVLTDRPLYRPGDQIMIWVFPFDTLTGMAWPSPLAASRNAKMDFHQWSLPWNYVIANLRVLDHKGKTIDERTLKTGFARTIDLPCPATGGVYQIMVDQIFPSDFVQIFSPGAREIEVRTDSRSNPQLTAEVSLDRRAYLPGTSVAATISDVVDLATGAHPLRGVKLRASLLVQDATAWTSAWLPLGLHGNRTVAIQIPPDASAATLSVQVNYGLSARTFVRPVPLISETDVSFFPATGNLVQGVKNTVFFQARSVRTEEPLELRGARLVTADDGLLVRDENGAAVRIVTGHEGRGSFDLVFEEGRKYALEIDDAGLRFDLPPAASGVVLEVAHSSGIFRNGEPIRVRAAASPAWKAAEVSIELRKRQKTLSARTWSMRKGSRTIELDPGNFTGVLRIIARHGSRILAENLVFVEPSRSIDVEIDTALKGDYGKIQIATSGAASLVFSIVDLSRLKQYPARRWPPSLRESVLLENEVDDLLSVRDYLGTDAEPLRLLLGVQAWRKLLDDPEYLAQRWANREAAKESLRLSRVLGVPLRPAKRRDPRMQYSPRATSFLSYFPGRPRGAEAAAAAGGPPVAHMFAAVEDAMEDARDDVDVGDDLEIVVDGDDVEAAAPFRALQPPPADAPPAQGRLKMMERRAAPEIRGETVYASNYIMDTSLVDGRHVVGATFTRPRPGTYLVRVDAWNLDGALGYSSAELIVKDPLTVDLVTPPHAFVKDRLAVQIAVRGQPRELILVDYEVSPSAAFHAQHKEDPNRDAAELYKGSETIQADAHGHGALKLPLQAAALEKVNVRVVARGLSSEATRQIERAIPILEARTLVTKSFGGIIEGRDFVFEAKIEGLPGKLVSNGRRIDVRAELFLDPSTQIIKTLNSLIREPHGCFEQTSSTTYPLIFLLRSLVGLQRENPRDRKIRSMVQDARKKLRHGYARLISFETSTGGFDWFGISPGHEALTAYGIVQFAELRRPELGLGGLVDEKMFERAKTWLLSRSNGEGGFKRSDRALDSFGRAPALTTDVYIIWALVRSGAVPASFLQAELSRLRQNLRQGKDPYILALSASALLHHDTGEKAAEDLENALTRLASMQNSDTGCIGQAVDMTITTSTTAEAHLTEVNALAAIAWLEADPSRWKPRVSASIRCVTSRVSRGHFGSTQATVFALQALTMWHEFLASANKELSVKLQVGAQEAAQEFEKGETARSQTYVLTETESELPLRLEASAASTTDAGVSVPFRLMAEYYLEHPQSSPDCALRLSVLGQGVATSRTVELGATVIAVHRLENRLDDGVAMPIAQIGFAAALEPDMESLRQLVASPQTAIEMFEIKEGIITLYWRGLGPREAQDFQIVFTARHAGHFVAPASSAYLYYEAEHRHYVDAGHFNVDASSGVSAEA